MISPFTDEEAEDLTDDTLPEVTRNSHAAALGLELSSA